MIFWIIIFPKLPANGMAVFPFILLQNNQKEEKVLINHEKIHLKQQCELLVIPFYVLYLFFYLVNLIRYKNHYQAYYNIPFEQEAYQNEQQLDYLSRRKFCAWLKYERIEKA